MAEITCGNVKCAMGAHTSQAPVLKGIFKGTRFLWFDDVTVVWIIVRELAVPTKMVAFLHKT